MKTIKQRVKKEIADKLNINVEVIDDEASLADLGANEVNEIEVLIGLENEFDIDIDDDDFLDCNTVSSIVELIEFLKRK